MHTLFSDYGMEAEWTAFLDSFADAPARAYRFNPLKIADFETFKHLHTQLLQEQQISSEPPERVPWSSDGVYLPPAYQPGKTQAYRAGLFYIQEASAMLPAEALNAKPGESVLDLCAAPGGKSARLAAALQGRGLLWSNDINAQRAKVLLKNLEQLGVSNAIVTIAEPAALAAALPARFDRVLIDAPCSGEGMFRRDPQAVSAWEAYSNEALLAIQAGLLRSAQRLLKAGGTIVYSTCTFNRAENEAQIERFLADYPAFTTVDIRPRLRDSSGLSDAFFEHRALRIWPQRAKGDGHFCCLLQSTAVENGRTEHPHVDPALTQKPDKALNEAREAFLTLSAAFLTEAAWNGLRNLPLWRWRLENLRLHLLPENPVELKMTAVKFLKTGSFLAELKSTAKGWIVKPSHSFLLTLRASELAYALNLTADDRRLSAYLKGETLSVTEQERAAWPAAISELWLPVLVENQPLGWAKLHGSTAKNLYPPGWRSQV